MSTSQIGIVLRDKHAVPNARLVLGKRIGAVLAENDLGGSYPEDLMNLMRQAVLSSTTSQPITVTFTTSVPSN